MKQNNLKSDLHVHSCHSRRPSAWILKKIGCAECYTTPIRLYQILRSRGMNVVTITDHNTINGCLEIAHLENAFISEEVTTYFPEDNCKIHVLVYDITEDQHGDILRARKNIFDLVDYLNGQDIVHAIAHPMCNLNGRLRPRHFEQCLLLFQNIELNGSQDWLQNSIIQDIVGRLTSKKIEELADIHGLCPRGVRPWRKALISGSDDHSSLYMGRSYTEVQGVSSIQAFLAGIGRFPTALKTYRATAKTSAHHIYSIMYQFYNAGFQLDRWVKDARLSAFFKEMLCPACREKQMRPRESTGCGKKGVFGYYTSLSAKLVEGARWFMSADRLNRRNTARVPGSAMGSRFLENAKQVISHLSEIEVPGDALQSSEERWFEFANDVSDGIVRQFAHEILEKFSDADLFYLFSHVGAAGSLYMMLSPYFIAYSRLAADRTQSLDCREGFRDCTANRDSGPRIAVFTDTFNQINGVTTAIQAHMEAARRREKPLTLITCDPEKRPATNVTAFEPIGSYDLPEYPELKVYYPPFLRILAYCYEAGFSHLHAETAGPMGLAALGVAKLLNLPFCGTYHTSLPQTVRTLTGDAQIEELFWKYIVWFYGQMDTIYVPSAVTGRELVEKGLCEDKITVHQSGVDTTCFRPEKRNGFFSSRYDVTDEHIKLLYVGRVSKEKNLDVLEEVMRRIHRIRKDVYLIVVGEGPYLARMEAVLKDLPVIFTGYLTGETLAEAYASSDIFVFPSTVDTMGIAVLEAQASGLPVIVTDQGGPSENMVDRETGFVVTVDGGRTADAFVEATLRLCDDPRMMSDMGRNARIYAQNRSFEKSFATFWDNYS